MYKVTVSHDMNNDTNKDKQMNTYVTYEQKSPTNWEYFVIAKNSAPILQHKGIQCSIHALLTKYDRKDACF